VRRYGDDPDKVVECVFGEGYRVSIAFDKALEVEDMTSCRNTGGCFI